MCLVKVDLGKELYIYLLLNYITKNEIENMFDKELIKVL
jgi:hypothetical protein